MNREIKFKFAFTNDKGDMVISIPYTIEQVIEKSIDDIWEELEACNCQPVGETNVVECACGDKYSDYSFKHVIEFTGQADPDGKDIYDGDLLQNGENKYIVGKVDGNCNWLGKTIDGTHGMLLSFCGGDKVIGNIQQTHELLKQIK